MDRASERHKRAQARDSGSREMTTRHHRRQVVQTIWSLAGPLPQRRPHPASWCLCPASASLSTAGAPPARLTGEHYPGDEDDEDDEDLSTTRMRIRRLMNPRMRRNPPAPLQLLDPPPNLHASRDALNNKSRAYVHQGGSLARVRRAHECACQSRFRARIKARDPGCILTGIRIRGPTGGGAPRFRRVHSDALSGFGASDGNRRNGTAHAC